MCQYDAREQHIFSAVARRHAMVPLDFTVIVLLSVCVPCTFLQRSSDHSFPQLPREPGLKSLI